MSLPAWQATIVKDNGDVLPGAEVTIVNEATGLNATIYSDRAGTVGKSNPFFADAEGFAQFYAAPGEYRITAVEAGSGTTRVWRYVPLVEKPNLIYNKQNILGTVSQSSGVPTGAIIERGSNANGEYIKYADGTLICTRTNVVIEMTTSTTGLFGSTSGLMYLGNTTSTFPHSFTVPPSISCQPFGTANTYVRQTATTTSSVTLQALNANAVASRQHSYQAIGRWY